MCQSDLERFRIVEASNVERDSAKRRLKTVKMLSCWNADRQSEWGAHGEGQQHHCAIASHHLIIFRTKRHANTFSG